MRAQARSQRAGLHGGRPSGRDPKGLFRCSLATARYHSGLFYQTPAVKQAHPGVMGVSQDSPYASIYKEESDAMLMTVKDLSEQLQIKPATLYAWAAQQKIPCLKIHGVIRFESDRIKEWLSSFGEVRRSRDLVIDKRRRAESVDSLIARAKRAVYTPGRGNQTNSEPK